MASTPADPSVRRPRPLSPHLSAWKPGVHMMVSITHRVTGDGMATVGTILLVWWLAAIAGGPASYGTFLHFFSGLWGGVFGYLFGIGLSWAFFQHMASGVRHLVLDTGAGYELKTNKRGAWLTYIFGAAATVIFWIYLLEVK